jgi:FAD/FMN-containing dehydrogenase/Fe-S oxidoreductase
MVVDELNRQLGAGKVLSDFPSKEAYAIDAGIYKIPPQAVVLLETKSDLETVLSYAQKTGIPLTPRSGGTNLTGSAIGQGIVLEFSRLNQILEIDTKGKWARVQPGITYAELNKRLEKAGLLFAPDPSSGDMCKLGGMLGTNAAGPHTLKYGSVKENVLSLEVLLADGRWFTVKPYRLDDPDNARLFQTHPLLKQILDLVRQNKKLIQTRRRHVSKNSSGYNLFDLADGLDRGIFDLPKLFIGSEGTLGLTLHATIKLVDRPHSVATGLIHFKRLEEIGPAVNLLLAQHPCALEVMDANTLDMIGRERFGIPPDAQAVLLVEFDQGDVRHEMTEAQKSCQAFSLCRPIDIAYEKEKQERLWAIRKAIYPTLYRQESKKRPINFCDDVVVPVRRLTELIAYLEKLFKDLNVPVAIYGHIGDGNAHINPLLDLNDPADLEKMIRISNEVHTTVIERFEGSLCGEHGDGRVRAEFLPALYGPELYRLFEQVKKIMDPQGILNPGIKLSSVPFTTHLDKERLEKSCATCGKCNSVCPVYDVTGEETNAARGWFHILTSPDYSYEKARRVVEACMNCRSCVAVCPAGIDVGALVLKKRAEHPNPLTSLVFGFQAKRLGLFEKLIKFAGLTQPLWDNRPMRALIEYTTLPIMKKLAPTARLPRVMILPRLVTRTLRERYFGLTEEGGAQGQVAYFHGCAANYFQDGVGDAVIELLKKQGVGVLLPKQRCSGTPIQTYGHLDIVRGHAEFNIKSLSRYDRIVTGCASCTLMLKQEYQEIFTDAGMKAKALDLSKRVMHITEFLIKEKGLRTSDRKTAVPSQRVTYHSSCHLRAAGVTKEPRQLLKQLSGMEYVEMQDADRCAGGAGTFNIKNPGQSSAIFERKRRAIEESGAEIVATSCPACMIQLSDGLRGKKVVKHVAQILNEAYEEGKNS